MMLEDEKEWREKMIAAWSPEFRAWVDSWPEPVRKLCYEFPIGITFNVSGTIYYLLGFTEDEKLIFSSINPDQDYEGALENKKYVCAEHFRANAMRIN